MARTTPLLAAALLVLLCAAPGALAMGRQLRGDSPKPQAQANAMTTVPTR